MPSMSPTKTCLILSGVAPARAGRFVRMTSWPQRPNHSACRHRRSWRSRMPSAFGAPEAGQAGRSGDHGMGHRREVFLALIGWTGRGRVPRAGSRLSCVNLSSAVGGAALAGVLVVVNVFLSSGDFFSQSIRPTAHRVVLADSSPAPFRRNDALGARSAEGTGLTETTDGDEQYGRAHAGEQSDYSFGSCWHGGCGSPWRNSARRRRLFGLPAAGSGAVARAASAVHRLGHGGSVRRMQGPPLQPAGIPAIAACAMPGYMGAEG